MAMATSSSTFISRRKIPCIAPMMIGSPPAAIATSAKTVATNDKPLNSPTTALESTNIAVVAVMMKAREVRMVLYRFR